MHAVCGLSNHIQLVGTAEDAQELAGFMCYANSSIAREAGRASTRLNQHLNQAGHRQLTHVYLLALAVRNGGQVATFDRRLPLTAVDGAKTGHVAHRVGAGAPEWKR